MQLEQFPWEIKQFTKPITKEKNTVLGKDVEKFEMKVLETEA